MEEFTHFYKPTLITDLDNSCTSRYTIAKDMYITTKYAEDLRKIKEDLNDNMKKGSINLVYLAVTLDEILDVLIEEQDAYVRSMGL